MKRRFQAGHSREMPGNDEQKGKYAGVGEQSCPTSLCAVCAWLWCDFHCRGNSTSRGAGRQLSLGTQQVKECKKTPR